MPVNGHLCTENWFLCCVHLVVVFVLMYFSKSEQRYREKVGGVKEMPCSCPRRKDLSVGHSLVVKRRLTEMGQFKM